MRSDPQRRSDRTAGCCGSSRSGAPPGSGSRRVDALQRDGEIEGQVRLQVVVRLVTASGSCGVRTQLGDLARGLVVRYTDAGGEHLAAGASLKPSGLRRIDRMAVGRDLAFEQGDRFASTGLPQVVQTQAWPLTWVH